jgi:hypothetical protein
MAKTARGEPTLAFRRNWPRLQTSAVFSRYCVSKEIRRFAADKKASLTGAAFFRSATVEESDRHEQG